MMLDGDKIRKYREKAGFTQLALGARLGISDRAVSKWERGLSLPSAENLLALSRVLGVSVDAFRADGEEGTAAPDAGVTARGMESLRELYKLGRGPSSSHTIGPERACLRFAGRYPTADAFAVTLYGSLAKTGKGHGTEEVIRKTLSPRPVTVRLDTVKTDLPHPNTMEISALREGALLARVRVMSVGGGSIVFEGEREEVPPRVYREDKFSAIAALCAREDIRLWEYVVRTEGEDFFAFLSTVWEQMKRSIREGLQGEGVLPGGLGVERKARTLYASQHIDESPEVYENRTVCAYAFAVSEQNAAGETIVTAPTCGAAGVLPAVLYYEQKKRRLPDEAILRALATAGLVGNLIKTNASISGAECGCQVEIGSACAMAAAALGELYGLSLDKIEYAAEIAIEHHLGLTCDPICGLVQIPCIERNAVAAMRAKNAVSLASFLYETRKISLDRVIHTMKETGLDMNAAYKETSEGGLARIRL